MHVFSLLPSYFLQEHMLNSNLLHLRKLKGSLQKLRDINLPALSRVVLYGYPMFTKRDHSDFFSLSFNFCFCVRSFVCLFFLNLTLLNDIIPSGKEC